MFVAVVRQILFLFLRSLSNLSLLGRQARLFADTVTAMLSPRTRMTTVHSRPSPRPPLPSQPPPCGSPQQEVLLARPWPSRRLLAHSTGLDHTGDSKDVNIITSQKTLYVDSGTLALTIPATGAHLQSGHYLGMRGGWVPRNGSHKRPEQVPSDTRESKV